MDTIAFTLNGQPVTVTAAPPHLTLLQYLRGAGLTGAKEGCAEGECGACSVLFAEPGPEGPRLVAVNSCLVLLPMVAGRTVYTVEGLAQGEELHPVQAALVSCGGSQCGYCTPGFVMSLAAEYYNTASHRRFHQTHTSSEAPVRANAQTPHRDGFDPECLSGNLCRCTGYRPIREAAASLGRPAADDLFWAGLRASLPVPPVPPAPLPALNLSGRFHRPASLPELLALRAAQPETPLIAGGTDLVVEANQRFRRFAALISLETVPELQAFTVSATHVEIGAGLNLSALEERLAREQPGQLPLLEQLFKLFASRLIRNRATLGGNLATASPIGDAAPVLLALDADVRLAHSGGERLLPLAEFFRGYRQTALQPDEVLVAVRIPLAQPRFSRLYKVAKRQRDDISTVSAAFAIDLDGAGRVSRARLAYGGVAATPQRAYAAEAALVGQPWTMATVQALQATLAGAFQPLSDHRGSAAYRQAMVANLLAKFYQEVAEAWVPQ